MPDLFNSFVSKAFLSSVWALEYEAYKDSEDERALTDRFRRWSARKDLRETSAEAAFIQEFFHDTWDYEQTGQAGSEGGVFTLWPKFAIAGAGERGGTGEADLAVGFFRKVAPNPVSQVLCEFKDIRSDLDAPTAAKRKQQITRAPMPRLSGVCASRAVPVRSDLADLGDRYGHERIPPLLVR
jgi:hypothetical protein